MIAIIFTVIALFSTPAQADQTGALMLNLGMWSTNRSLCGSGAQCIAITNISYTECVAVGFQEGDVQMQLGNMVFLSGNAQTSVWVKDGPDPDLNLDPESCIPPRATVWGPVPNEWTVVHLQSTKYFVGDIRTMTLDKMSYYVQVPNPLNPSQALLGQFFGQYYAGTGQGLPNRCVPGSVHNTYTLARYPALIVGG